MKVSFHFFGCFYSLLTLLNQGSHPAHSASETPALFLLPEQSHHLSGPLIIAHGPVHGVRLERVKD